MHLPRGLIHSPQQNKQSARKPWIWPRARFSSTSSTKSTPSTARVTAPEGAKVLCRKRRETGIGVVNKRVTQ
ncbi:MAG TPA: hypothetical protein VKY85_16875 [Candidatus Angelobacter sp.]|nr:hypothetical protein [Candidatus Angelobacter sp.]